MTEKTAIWDPADSLSTPETVAYFLTDVFETGNAAYIANALGVVARAEGMSEVARKTGLSREALYRSLTENGNPTLKSVMLVMDALGLTLAVQPKAADSQAAAEDEDERDVRQA